MRENDVIDNLAKYVLGDLYRKAAPHTYNNYEISRKANADDESDPILWIRFYLFDGFVSMRLPVEKDIQFALADPDVANKVQQEIRRRMGWTLEKIT
jgi:hypothetical protein